ncbi:MAG: mechanosensitive ion channel [Flavobacteriaceae bacterium]|nr:mechanosensitive ion channel [Flavobacteriaceae bacterium]
MDKILNYINKLINYLDYEVHIGENISFSMRALIIVIFVFILTKFFLKLFRKILFRSLEEDAKYKFKSVFSFFNYFIYIIVTLITFDTIGVDITAIFAASAALLVGVGLALRTYIEDIISGIFIIADKSVHVGDVIQVEGKVGKVQNINLRTTRAVTIENKVLIIPNHKFLKSILFSWTENGAITKDYVEVGVSYGTSIELVQNLLLKIAEDHPKIIKNPKPSVLFCDFGDNALELKLLFSLNDSFNVEKVKSDIRYSVYKIFNKNNIEIPFPQRELWIKKSNLENEK